MTPVRQRMIEDMQVRNLSPHDLKRFYSRYLWCATGTGNVHSVQGTKQRQQIKSGNF